MLNKQGEVSVEFPPGSKITSELLKCVHCGLKSKLYNKNTWVFY